MNTGKTSPTASARPAGQVVLMRGLPGCGKTTYARRWVDLDPTGRAAVCRDDIRDMLHGGWTGVQAQEDLVTAVERNTITTLVRAGRDVVVHNTNLKPQELADLLHLAADLGAPAEIVDMTNVPVDVCLAQDVARASRGERHTGPEVIIKKWEQWVENQPYPLPVPEITPLRVYEDPGVPAPYAVLVDLDGTVCLRGERSPYDLTRVGEDAPNLTVLGTVRMYARTSHRVIFLSGRHEKCRPDTEKWLARYWGRPYDHLLMRPDGDVRSDDVVKREMFDRHVRNRYRVRVVLDDRDRVVGMWRRLGLTVYQVAPGDF